MRREGVHRQLHIPKFRSNRFSFAIEIDVTAEGSKGYIQFASHTLKLVYLPWQDIPRLYRLHTPYCIAIALVMKRTSTFTEQQLGASILLEDQTLKYLLLNVWLFETCLRFYYLAPRL